MYESISDVDAANLVTTLDLEFELAHLKHSFAHEDNSGCFGLSPDGFRASVSIYRGHSYRIHGQKMAENREDRAHFTFDITNGRLAVSEGDEAALDYINAVLATYAPTPNEAIEVA